jgi:hypothetical protein
MITLLIAFTIADLLITWFNMNHPSFYELNPIARYLMYNYGVFGLVVLKIVTSIPFILGYRHLTKSRDKYWQGILICDALLFSVFVFWFWSWGTFLWYNL